MIKGNQPLSITGITLQIVIRPDQFVMLLYVLNVPLQSSAEDDTAYSPVNDKEKEDPQNGTYIGLTPKANVEA